MTNELPFVRGGYTFKKYTVAGQDVTLTIPQDPDQLLDDENVIAKSTTSGVMPYWASMWPAAEPATRFIMRQNWPKREAIHELGCGLALTGITLMKAGYNIHFSDHSDDAMELLRQNLLRNALPETKTDTLDWRSPPDDLKYNIVYAVDVLYETQNHAPLLSTMKKLLHPNGVAYVFDPGRRLALDFCALALDTGWQFSATDEYAANWSLSPSPNSFQVFKLQLEN